MANTATAQAQVDARRARIASLLDRPLDPAAAGEAELTDDQFEFLVAEAQDLYFNELAWEELTDEESVSGGHLTELVFPGFLAFIEALLNDSAPDDSQVLARPHPEVVEELLVFLSEQHIELAGKLERGVDSERIVWARVMTQSLIDLVLYRLHDLDDTEREVVEAAG